MIDYRFADGTALVTGAASGIGEALAYALAERGSHLILLDRAADRLAAVAADVGRRHPAGPSRPTGPATRCCGVGRRARRRVG
jgi:NAD(P)-dependent dehydrogenase (short-subunit alcohol dehydrogenase family)